jgi:hypothetical protein
VATVVSLQVLSRGWSLTDPDMSGYSSTLNHLPLDQSYIYPGKQSHHCLIANERATESTVTLPIATAIIMDLAGKAAEKSCHHANSISRMLKEHRHDYKDTEHKATCTLGVVGVAPLPSSSSLLAGAAANLSSATITIACHRPDFELEIVANEPIPIPSPNVVAGFAADKHTFYPKLVTQEAVLPGILQAYGSEMPSAGFLLGGLQIGVDWYRTYCTSGTVMSMFVVVFDEFRRNDTMCQSTFTSTKSINCWHGKLFIRCKKNRIIESCSCSTCGNSTIEMESL